MTSILLGAFGPTELIPIAALVLLFFGGKKLPSLMKGIGQGIREFKEAKDGKTTAAQEIPASTTDAKS